MSARSPSASRRSAAEALRTSLAAEARPRRRALEDADDGRGHLAGAARGVLDVAGPIFARSPCPAVRPRVAIDVGPRR